MSHSELTLPRAGVRKAVDVSDVVFYSHCMPHEAP